MSDCDPVEVPDDDPLEVAGGEAPEEHWDRVHEHEDDDLDRFGEGEESVAIVPSAGCVLRLIWWGLSHPEFVVICLEPVESLDGLKWSKHNPRIVLSLVPGFDSYGLIEVRDLCHKLYLEFGN